MTIIQNLKEQGHRITPQRQSILDVMKDHPMTVDEIHSSLTNKDVDLASVYRTVKLLKQTGLIQEIDFGDGKKRYELLDRTDHHHHIVCNSCGVIEDIIFPNEERLLRHVKNQSQFIVKRHTLEFFGLCQNCQ